MEILQICQPKLYDSDIVSYWDSDVLEPFILLHEACQSACPKATGLNLQMPLLCRDT